MPHWRKQPQRLLCEKRILQYIIKSFIDDLNGCGRVRNSEYGPKEKNQVYQLSKFQWPSGTELFHQYPGKCSAPQDGKCDSMEWTLI